MDRFRLLTLTLSLVCAAFATTLSARAARGDALDLQDRFGTGWERNNPVVRHLQATLLAIEEMTGSPPSPGTPAAPGFLKLNGYDPKIAEFFKRWLPFFVFVVPQDLLSKITLPPDDLGTEPIPTARTKEGLKGISGLQDLALDMTVNSSTTQAHQIVRDTFSRSMTHRDALDSILHDGGGLLPVVKEGGPIGPGGQDLGMIAVPSGVMKSLYDQTIAAGLRVLATIQDPGTQVGTTDPRTPLQPNFIPSPSPPQSGALPGGSTAGADTAEEVGIFPGGQTFPSPESIDPSALLPDIANRVNDLLGGLGGLGEGGTGSPPRVTEGPPDPTCSPSTARRSPETVLAAAQALQLRTDVEWTISILEASRLFGITGTDTRTGERLVIGNNLLATGSCVWVVSAATEAVFVSDTELVVFRLTDMNPL